MTSKKASTPRRKYSTSESPAAALVLRSSALGTLYVETSAVLRIMIEGDRTLHVPLRRASRLVTSALTFVEADRGVRRALADGRLTALQYRKVSRWLGSFEKACEIISLNESVLQRAQQTFPQEPVRTLDALHLASAQIWAEGVEPLTMVSHDHRVRENARAWGVAVLP